MGFRNEAFHQNWYKLLQPQNDPKHFSPYREHPLALKKFHLEGPRKHGKSQCVAINYPSWLIAVRPDIHITIVSKTATLAENSLGEIIQRIETDPKYYELFGNIKPKKPRKWTTGQIFVKRKEISKFPTIHATGIYGPLTGGGNDLIIADDIIDEENVTTQAQIKKAELWFYKVLLTTLFPWGACIAIGTRWHYNDLYSGLLEKWPHEVLPAILNEKEIAQGKPPKVLWPEFWPYNKLMEKKNDIGSVFFNCQYQNDPTTMEGELLKSEWLHSWEKPPLPGMPRFGGVDPALGEGHLQSIATFAYERHHKQIYLIEVWTGKLGWPDFLRKLKAKHVEHNYSKIYVETNAFQKVIMLIPEFRQGLPMVETVTDANKERRFVAMSSHFESSRVLVNPLINSPKHEFWIEWVQFPYSQYDDGLASTEIGLRNLIVKAPSDAWLFG